MSAELKTTDPKQTILNKVGSLDGFHLMGNQVLVGVYVRDKIGNIIVSDTTKLEDEFQGKVGLILKTGPKAFDREYQEKYGDRVVPKVGDWVTFKVYDSWQQKINKEPCRQMEDTKIRAVVSQPDMVY